MKNVFMLKEKKEEEKEKHILKMTEDDDGEIWINCEIHGLTIGGFKSERLSISAGSCLFEDGEELEYEQ